VKLCACHPLDDEHVSGTNRTSCVTAWRKLLQGCRGAEECTAAQQRCGPSAVGEEAEVADANQASGQDVDEKAPQELICGDRHDLLLAATGVILPAEGDATVVVVHQTMVGDGDAVSIASEVMRTCSAPPKGGLA
jgi:hypothetical protein